MPPPDDHNSSWNRRDEFAPDDERDAVDGLESQQYEDWYSREIDDDAEEFDLSLKFEDYAPVWLQKLKTLYDSNPEWSVASAIGSVALILTTILLLSMPVPPDESLTEEPAPEIPITVEPEVIPARVDAEPIDTRVAVNPDESFEVVLVESDPLLVSFGDLQNPIVERTQPLETRPPLAFPAFDPPASAPELALNVQRIRVIEREMLDPGIDEPFVVKSQADSAEMSHQLSPADRLLFNQDWKEINLARADQQTEPVIRPTLYHERFPGGEHLQVGREQPQELSRLDHLTRVTAPQQQEQLELEIRKQAPREGTSEKLLAYSILIKNRGNAPAYDVQVEETISPTASLVDLTPPAQVKQNLLTWKIAQLEPGEERELLVKIFPKQTGNVQTSSEIRLASNVASATKIAAPQLMLQMNGPEAVSAGEVFAIDFVVTNQGQQTQNNVNLNLDLPDGLTHDQGRQLTFKIDQLAGSESRRLRARVKALKTGPVTSQAALVLQDQALENATLKQNVNAPRTTPTQPAPQTPAAPAGQPATPAASCPCQPPVYYLPAPYLVP